MIVLITTKNFLFDMVTIFDKGWGSLVCECSKYKVDFLPRLTLVVTPHVSEVGFGFLFIQFRLYLWGDRMKDLRKNDHASVG